MRYILRIACLLTLLAASRVQAQQDPMFTMNMFNKQVMNPAYAGGAGAMQLVGAARSQWVGIDGHPNTFTLSFNAPVSLLRGGLGVHLTHDVIGPFSTTFLRGSYAFHLPIGGNGAQLQLGIAPGFYFKQLNTENFRAAEGVSNDPVLRDLQQRVLRQNSFDLGAGVFFQVPTKRIRDGFEKAYIGLFADHLLEPELDEFSGTGETKLARSFQLMAGYRFGDGPVSFMPNAYFRMAASQMQVDLVGNLHVYPMVVGLGYRGLTNVSDAMLLLGFHASSRLFAAYSYDYTLSALNVASSGSHELVVSYLFPQVARIYPPNLDVKHNPYVR